MSISVEEYSDEEYFEEDYEEESTSACEYLLTLFRRMVNHDLPFSCWDNPDTQRGERKDAERFKVTISSRDMRKYLKELYDQTLDFPVKSSIERKYGFYQVVCTSHAGRHMTAVHVQFMEEFTLQSAFLGPVIEQEASGCHGCSCSGAVAKIFGRGADGSEPAFMDASVSCRAISELLQRVCEKVLASVGRTRQLGSPGMMKPPSTWMRMNGMTTKGLSKKLLQMINIFDEWVDKVYDHIKDYSVGDCVLDMLDCEAALANLNKPEANAVLSYLRKQRQTFLEDKRVLAGLLMDPRLNHRESELLTSAQKEIALNHLMSHQKSHNRLCEKVKRMDEEYRRTNNIEQEEEELDSLCNTVKCLAIWEQPMLSKGALRKKLRALDQREPLGKDEDVLDYWREREEEEPALAVLACMAFLETNPWVSEKALQDFLERQKTTDEEYEKLIFLYHNSRNFSGSWYYPGKSN